MTARVKDKNEIFLNGTRFKIKGRVRPGLVSILPGKVTIGEYSLVDDLVASNWVINDQRGGILVEKMDEATQQDRAWYSTCYLGSKGHIILPVLATDCGSPTDAQPQVSYVSAGAGANNGGSGNVTPAFPSSPEYRDLFILQVMIRNTTDTPTTPTGWILLYGPDSNESGRQWLYYKFSDGLESGNLTVTISTSNRAHARIYSFRNVSLSSFTEDASFGYGSDDSIEAESITTTAAKRLAVSFNFVHTDNAVGDFTGESGGDWEEAVAEYATNYGCLQLQIATMASAGTVSGGSYTMASSEAWGVRAFALISKASALSSTDPELIYDYEGVTYAFFGHYLQSFDNDNDDFNDNSEIFWATPTDVLIYKGAVIVAFGDDDNIWQYGLPALDKFIDNPYFKEWSGGYPVDWGFDVPSGASVEQNTDTDYINKGKYSLKLVTNGTSGDSVYARQKMPFSNVLRSKTVTLTFYAIEENAACGSKVTIKDGSGTTDSDEFSAVTFGQLTIEHTFADDATKFEIEVNADSDGSHAWFSIVDDFEISFSGFTDWEDMRQTMKYLTSIGDTIYGIDEDGVFYTSKVGIEYTEKCRIPDQFSVVNGLSTYLDASGNLIPYVSTDVGDFVYDSDNEELVRTALKLPSHPLGGKHPVHWRDGRYVPVGLDIRKYIAGSPATISEVGLNKDDGLPTEYQGEITGLYEGPNEMFALVDSTYGSGTVYSSLMSYDTLGWQVKWLSSTAGKAFKCACLSSSYDEYRFFFGTNYKVYHIPIERNIRNPLKIPSFPFAASADHFTPWFDADWIGDKLGLSLVGKFDGMSSTEKVTIYYRIDEEDTDIASGWTQLVEISEDGEHEFKLPKSSNEGLVSSSIQFKAHLERGDTNTNTPDINWLKLRYLKLLDTKWGWNVTLDLSWNDEKYKGNSKSQSIEKIKEIIASKKLQEFTFRDDAGGKHTDWVKVSNAGGDEDTGLDWKGEYNISLVAP